MISGSSDKTIILWDIRKFSSDHKEKIPQLKIFHFEN